MKGQLSESDWGRLGAECGAKGQVKVSRSPGMRSGGRGQVDGLGSGLGCGGRAYLIEVTLARLEPVAPGRGVRAGAKSGGLGACDSWGRSWA